MVFFQQALFAELVQGVLPESIGTEVDKLFSPCESLDDRLGSQNPPDSQSRKQYFGKRAEMYHMVAFVDSTIFHFVSFPVQLTP